MGDLLNKIPDYVRNDESSLIKQSLILFGWIVLCVLSRVLPHIPNMTPLISLALMTGVLFSKRLACLWVLLALLISDVALAWFYGYAVFGSWTFFTYTGFALITLFGFSLSKESRLLTMVGFAVTSSLGFWLWTNIGSWWQMYPHTWQGVVVCYSMALPFLRASVLGSVATMVVLRLLLQRVSLINFFFCDNHI